MTAITWVDVENVCTTGPDLAIITAVPVGGQNAILAHVNTTLNVCYFPPLLEASPKLFLARCYLAAHFAVAATRRPTVVTAEGELDLSTSYGLIPLPSIDDPFWYLSGFGIAYRSLIRNTTARLPFVV